MNKLRNILLIAVKKWKKLIYCY